MARIRSIKPEFFQHESLFDLEKNTGLPVRIAYIGLWTQTDRRGLFRWRPKELKLNILPWDDSDFAAILDALASGGFIVRYEVDGSVYGRIPSFGKHQVFNVREAPAKNIPDVPTQSHNGTNTVPVPSGREGKGKEGNGDMEGRGTWGGEPDAASRLGPSVAHSPPREAGTGVKPSRKRKPSCPGCADPLCCEQPNSR